MPEQKVDVLTVRWYERPAGAPDIVTRWLAAAREHLPEAVPRRFGEDEPLPEAFGTDEALRSAWAKAGGLLFLTGEPPVYHAALGTGGTRIHVHSLDMVTEPGDERVRRFALGLTHPGTVYVSASMSYGQILDDGTIYGPAEQPGEPYLAPWRTGSGCRRSRRSGAGSALTMRG